MLLRGSGAGRHEAPSVARRDRRHRRDHRPGARAVPHRRPDRIRWRPVSLSFSLSMVANRRRNHRHVPRSMTRPGLNGAGAARRVFFDHGELKHVVLALIAEQPRHGYDIIRVIEQRTGGAYCPSPGVIYPTLSLLESFGHVRAAGADGPRNRYRITAAGRAFLADNKALVDEIFRRMQHVVAQVSAPSAVVTAMDGLKAALRSPGRPWSTQEASLVAAAIDAAAADRKSTR